MPAVLGRHTCNYTPCSLADASVLPGKQGALIPLLYMGRLFSRSPDKNGPLACLLQIAWLLNVLMPARAWVGRQDQLESPRSNEHAHRDQRNATRRLCQARAR